MRLIIDGWRRIVPEGHVEAIGTFPIESAETGLIEKEEHGGDGDAVPVFGRIELRACPVIEGFLRGRTLFRCLWAAIQHLGLMLASARIGIDERLKRCSKGLNIRLKMSIERDEDRIRIAGKDRSGQLTLAGPDLR